MLQLVARLFGQVEAAVLTDVVGVGTVEAVWKCAEFEVGQRSNVENYGPWPS